MVKTLYSILHRSLDLTEFMEEVLIDDNMVFDIDNLKGFLNDTSSFGFIAKENNKIIGFAYCYTLLRPDGKTMFYLHSIGMLPNYQDKGYGSKLLSFIKEYSKEIGCSEMFLITDKGNPRACHVYEKLGGKNDYKDEIVYVYDYEKPVDTAINAVDKMKSSLGGNPATIYDLGSIGPRIEAITDVIEAINFSTHNLTNKVSQANVDMGFGITKLVIRIADPFASVDSIKAQVAEVKQLEQKVMTYPDLKPTDKATIYTKSKLDKAIWDIRVQRDQKVLNKKSFDVYNALNKAITHAVGVQLNPNVTVQEVDQEIVNLQMALQTALK